MCGIAGIVAREGISDEDASILRVMASLLTHRGPDSEGFFISGRVALGHRRLSIIDLSDGSQPMATEDGRFTIVFNGEIYNFLELRKDLEGLGHRFRTRSDTEVLLAAYRQWREGCLSRVNGMFAFAVWDEDQQSLFAARDRVGKKPLFYSRSEKRFLFASEMKSILAHPAIQRDIDVLALDEYLTYKHIPAPRTIYRQIRKLEPGHYLTWKNGDLRLTRYWQISFADRSQGRSEESLLEELQERFTEAVRLRMISDVPIGAFLSGGLDSSAVVGVMAGLSPSPIRTFTIGFSEERYSEIEDARRVAKRFGTEHEEFIVEPSAVEVLPDIVWHFDEPFGDSSAIPTYYVSKMAARRVKVVLSGDGGDEVFGGYKRYLEAINGLRFAKIPEAVRKSWILPIASRLPVGVPGRNLLYSIGSQVDAAPGYRLGIYPFIKERLYNRSLKKMLENHNPFEVTDRSLRESSHLDIVSRLQYLDISDYLHNDILVKVDRMSMAHSIELRSPILDYKVMEFMAGIPPRYRIFGGVTKVLFRKLLKGLLPAEAFDKPKQGFGIPGKSWFREDLRDFASSTILEGDGMAKEYLDIGMVRKIFREHEKGRRDYSEWIWCLLVLELWHKRFGASSETASRLFHPGLRTPLREKFKEERS